MVKISVIMGAYNCEDTIVEALESLLYQSFQDFEIIICDDGSSDNTFRKLKKIKKMNSNKIKLLNNAENKGLNYTLNKCLKHAEGQYIARMDADDISHQSRFKVQNHFLDNNLNYDFVSSNMLFFDETGDWGVSNVKSKPNKDDFAKNSPFPHAPVMVRREAYIAVGGYSEDKKLLRVEDYHLWIKLYAAGFNGYNLKKILYKMRDDQNAYNRRTFQNRINEAYVRAIAIKELNLSFLNIIYVFRPLIVGLLPKNIYMFLHKKKLNR